MNLGIKLCNDREIECNGVFKIGAKRELHIHTNEITFVEAYQLFTDKETIKTVSVIKNDNEVKRFNGYTELFGIQRSEMIENPDEIMIILRRPDFIDEDI